MRIAHISDLHIRNFKYRREYRAAFGNLYFQLHKLKPDLIINTGDTVHSKLAVSPELFDDVTTHIRTISSISEYWMILGNHDLNLKNKGRTDAISPIIRALYPSANVRLLGEGFVESIDNFDFFHFDIRRPDFPCEPNRPDAINIGLYHGSISGCVTDIGFVMEDGESEVSRFDKMDFVLMGDIHKRQSFRGGRMQYPGSLIQQNYGEELVKGFLLWDIRSKDDFTVDFHEVDAPGRFYTVQVPASLDISGIDVPEGSRIRAMVQGDLSPSKRWQLERALFDRFKPLEVITPDASNERASLDPTDIDELIGSRDKLMREHLVERGFGDVADEVVALFHQFESQLEIAESRATTWQLKRLTWDNMLNYGEGNEIDLTKLGGLVGIFAPNASGKSSLFDILLQALFDKISKEVPRNIDLVNDNKDVGTMSVEFEAGGNPYSIERTIERIHYGQRKFTETKQWGKTSLSFLMGEQELNGVSRPETERAIRDVIGNFEDFVLTTMVSQNPIFGVPGGADIINCKETDRRKILFRFLDLDLYERIHSAVKEELKELMGKLKGLDRDKLQTQIDELLAVRQRMESAIITEREELMESRTKLEEQERLLGDNEVQDVLELITNRDLWQKQYKDELVMAAKAAADEHVTATEILKVRAALAELEANPPNQAPIPMADLVVKLAEVRKSREKKVVEVSQNGSKYSAGLKILDNLNNIPCNGQFPDCKFISDAIQFQGIRDVVERGLTLLNAEISGMNSEITKLEEHQVVHRKFVEWEKKVSDAKLRISRLETIKAESASAAKTWALDADTSKTKLDQLDDRLRAADPERIHGLKAKISELRATVDALEEKVQSLDRQVGANQAKAEALEEQLQSLDGLKERARIHEGLAELCGKNGLPYRILTMVLPIINAEIAKILTGVVKFSVFFEDDPEEQSVSLYIRYGDYKSRPLSLGSGAEKFIASLAVRVALLSVSSLPKTDLLIIDEGFGKLDPEHLEALQKMFEYLKEAFGTVFIVSHVDFMRDIVDHSIEITGQGGYAHVEVS